MADKSFIDPGSYPHSAPAYQFGPSTNPALAQQTADPGYWDWYSSVFNTAPAAQPAASPTNPGPSFSTGKDPSRLTTSAWPPAAQPGQGIKTAPPMPVPRPNVTPTVTTLPQRAAAWPPAWAQKASRPAQTAVRGSTQQQSGAPSRSAPAMPQLPQLSTAAGYLYTMGPQGNWINVGRVNPALSPADTYAMRAADTTPNGRDWAGANFSGVTGASGQNPAAFGGF